MDWKRELVIAHLVKQKIAEVDLAHLWENTLPGVAASEAQIRTIESCLGYSFDPQHREFLLHANGWRALFHNLDVFELEDFVGGVRANRASVLMETLEPLEELCGFGMRNLLPFAVSSESIDVMAITRSHTKTPGKVFWFAGDVVDSYNCFDDWFLAMVDYNRLEYKRLRGQV